MRTHTGTHAHTPLKWSYAVNFHFTFSTLFFFSIAQIPTFAGDDCSYSFIPLLAHTLTCWTNATYMSAMYQLCF